ncbi:hypothetical protein M2361_005092 [Achromobacter sp. JUb104]|nr:hypothetical protein [Achromobacter sp. JUb104]
MGFTKEPSIATFIAAATPQPRARLHEQRLVPPPRHKSMMVSIEQHLVRLEPTGAQEEGAAVAKLELRDLELGALAVDHRALLAPVKMKGVARCERQWHEGAPS